MEKYEELSKKAAYQVTKAIRLFQDEPEHIRKQAQKIIMQRVNRMLVGENVTIDDPRFVTRIHDPNKNQPINNPEGDAAEET